MPVSTPQNLPLCFITDDKAGHYTQLRGLLHGLEQYLGVEAQWLTTEAGFWSCFRQLKALPQNAVVAGAGGDTWRYLVVAKKLLGLRTIVLLRPRRWPLSWFDWVVAPYHDGLTEGGRVLCTEGVLNPTPPAVHPDPSAGVILIGGPSRHHGWDESSLLEQIKLIVTMDEQRTWRLTTSRRTPEHFATALRNLESSRLTVLPVDTTPPNWVRDRLLDCSAAWVTEDSMSMVFEGLSAGIQVGLLSMLRQRPGRVTDCIDDLVARHWVTPFEYYRDHQHLLPAVPPLQEAKRVGAALAAMINPAMGDQYLGKQQYVDKQ